MSSYVSIHAFLNFCALLKLWQSFVYIFSGVWMKSAPEHLNNLLTLNKSWHQSLQQLYSVFWKTKGHEKWNESLHKFFLRFWLCVDYTVLFFKQILRHVHTKFNGDRVSRSLASTIVPAIIALRYPLFANELIIHVMHHTCSGNVYRFTCFYF